MHRHFHKDPSFQRGILSNPNNLPHQANIKIGDETLDLLVTAVRDHDNNYVAAMLTWSIITEKVKADAASYRLEQMVQGMPVNVMMLEIENFTITYANETSITTLKQLEHLLPIKADEIVGQCVDIFHKDPSFQRRILADPKNLPHKAIIKVGDESLDLLVSAVHDRDGNYIAAMLTWSVVTEKLKQEAEAQRLQQMIEGMPINVMMCDPDTLELNYLNKQSRETLKSIEHLLPVKAEDMFGQCIDIFHKDPAHQRRLLADPKNLPHKAKIELGEHTLSLDVSAVMGPNGEYIGPMVAWSVITDQINMANDVANAEKRASLLFEIAALQLEVGEIGIARETIVLALAAAQDVHDIYDRSYMMRIALEQFEKAQHTEADQALVNELRSAMMRIDESRTPVEDFLDAAKSKFEAGDLAGAIAIMDQGRDKALASESKDDRDYFLIRIIADRSMMGDIHGALADWALMSDGAYESGWHEIAVAQAKVGDIDGIRKLLMADGTEIFNEPVLRYKIIPTLVQNGYFAYAHKLADTMDKDYFLHEEAMIEIAKGEASASNFDEALAADSLVVRRRDDAGAPAS